MPSARVRIVTPFLFNANSPSPPLSRRTRACAASFSTTASAQYAAAREPTLYEILNVPVTATAAEIKKQFYSLSLRHHPDRNRDDPTASSRFARISSAYHVLSNAAKRSNYDREHGIAAYHASSTHSTAAPGQHPMGSYSSYAANAHSRAGSYAGSRPASGLNKRRGTFRGPPPSFYAHGGYGRAARPAPGDASTSAGAGTASSGRDEDPTSFIHRNTVHHFNARGHFRTQTAEDTRRRERRSREMGADINEQYLGRPGDFALRFAVVCGILLGAGAMTGWLRWPAGEKAGKSGRSKEH